MRARYLRSTTPDRVVVGDVAQHDVSKLRL
jgi:hypothetical protein